MRELLSFLPFKELSSASGRPAGSETSGNSMSAAASRNRHQPRPPYAAPGPGARCDSWLPRPRPPASAVRPPASRHASPLRSSQGHIHSRYCSRNPKRFSRSRHPANGNIGTEARVAGIVPASLAPSISRQDRADLRVAFPPEGGSGTNSRAHGHPEKRAMSLCGRYCRFSRRSAPEIAFALSAVRSARYPLPTSL
jgi:hypothetical protein